MCVCIHVDLCMNVQWQNNMEVNAVRSIQQTVLKKNSKEGIAFS